MIKGSLSGKTALVTGASRGIGAEIALQLAREGVLVAAHYGASADAANALVAKIAAEGGSAFALEADLRSPPSIAAMFETLDRELQARAGGRELDILVNCAGVAGGGSIPQTSEEVFDKLFDTNVKGPFFVMQQAVPRLRDEGRVVNIGSVAARGSAAPRAAYSASKLALHGLSLSLAQELAPRRITVNVVAPGAVDTDLIAQQRKAPGFDDAVIAMTAFGRLGQADDIAGAVLLLLQPQAAWMTGQIIEVSGGLRL